MISKTTEQFIQKQINAALASPLLFDKRVIDLIKSGTSTVVYGAGTEARQIFEPLKKENIYLRFVDARVSVYKPLDFPFVVFPVFFLAKLHFDLLVLMHRTEQEEMRATALEYGVPEAKIMCAFVKE